MRRIFGYDVRIFWAWCNCWVGFFWDRESRHLYLCPIPMLVFEIWWEYSTVGRLLERLALDPPAPPEVIAALKAAADVRANPNPEEK